MYLRGERWSQSRSHPWVARCLDVQDSRGWAQVSHAGWCEDPVTPSPLPPGCSLFRVGLRNESRVVGWFNLNLFKMFVRGLQTHAVSGCFRGKVGKGKTKTTPSFRWGAVCGRRTGRCCVVPCCKIPSVPGEVVPGSSLGPWEGRMS